MTSIGHAVFSVSLLHCSFTGTGEAIRTTKLLKPMLGNCSTNRRVTNIQRMTNDPADFWKPPKSFCSDLLTPRVGLFSGEQTSWVFT